MRTRRRGAVPEGLEAVAQDGTHFEANASKHKAMGHGRLISR
ncbi:hypothetical protein [Streptomyces canus]